MVMMTKVVSINIINFMTPWEVFFMLRRSHISHLVKCIIPLKISNLAHDSDKLST